MLIVFDEKNPHSAVIAGWRLWVTYFMNAIQIVWFLIVVRCPNIGL